MPFCRPRWGFLFVISEKSCSFALIEDKRNDHAEKYIGGNIQV